MSDYIIHDTTLTSIANAIRTKTGSNAQMTPSEMATAIGNISTGGSSPKTYTISGSLNYFNDNGLLDEVIEDNNWIFNNVSGLINTFSNTHILDQNFTITTTGTSCDWGQSVFNWNSTTREPYIRRPKIIGPLRSLTGLYYGEHGDDARLDLTEAYLIANSNGTNILAGFLQMSKRKDLWDFAIDMPLTPSSIITTATLYFYNAPYTNFGRETYAAGIKNIPVITSSADTSNIFSSTFSQARAAKHITFALSNGNPIVANWYGATLDLSSCGFKALNGSLTALDYYPELAVTDATSYNNLKNETYWWSVKQNYSRYNKISAIETINSLPDTSACVNSHGSANIIKFRGDAGSNTDGGAINTMTSAEIAVATNKGWTVQFV